MPSAIKRINRYNAGIPDTLREIKWKALTESPFRFFRGTAHLFAEDFVKQYKYKPKLSSWICGDLHFENFGSYKGDNRLVYFDLNDFDEAILASPEPEIARFLTSVIIALEQMKVSESSINKTLQKILESYTTTLTNGKALMLEAEVAHGVFKSYFDKVANLDRQAFIGKRTEMVKGGTRMLKIDNLRFLPIPDELKFKIYSALNTLFKNNKRFEHLEYNDAAFRIAGTGSLGLQRYCVLCYNPKKEKLYLIDIKESRQSCFSGMVEIKQPDFAHEAERINKAAHLMQFTSPAFISSVQIDGKWFMVKEMQRVSDKMSLLDFENDFETLGEVAKQMAVLIAYSHLRSSGHFGASPADDLKKFAELLHKKLSEKIIDVSQILAKKNNRYYEEFMYLQ